MKSSFEMAFAKRLIDVAEVAFFPLAVATWQVLAWFGKEYPHQLSARLLVVVVVCVGLGYSVCLKGRFLTKVGWRPPQHWVYWPAALLIGIGGFSAVAVSVTLSKQSLGPVPRGLSAQLLTVTAGPIVEEF